MNANFLWSKETGIVLCEEKVNKQPAENIPEWTTAYLDMMDPRLDAESKTRLIPANYDSVLASCTKPILTNLLMDKNSDNFSTEQLGSLEKIAMTIINSEQQSNDSPTFSAILPVAADTNMYISTSEGTASLLTSNSLIKLSLEEFSALYQEHFEREMNFDTFYPTFTT